MNPLKLFVGALLTVLLLAGAPLMYAWDRRPPNVPAPIVFHVLFFHPAIRFPPSLKAQLAERDRLLAQAVANERTLADALNLQNGRVRALAAAGAGLRAEAANAATAYRSALAAQSKPEAQIIAAGSGPGDVSERAANVDRAFLAELRQ